MHNPIRPFTMVLCKYNEQKEIETFQCQYDCRRDVEMVVELNKGFYVLWLYIDYEHIKNDERFKYVLRISSSKEIKVEFVGMDSKYYLIQKYMNSYLSEREREILDLFVKVPLTNPSLRL